MSANVFSADVLLESAQLSSVQETSDKQDHWFRLAIKQYLNEVSDEEQSVFNSVCFTQVLIDWINDVLVGERIIVKDLAEDLYDGQVLQKLFGRTITGTLGIWRHGVGLHAWAGGSWNCQCSSDTRSRTSSYFLWCQLEWIEILISAISSITHLAQWECFIHNVYQTKITALYILHH